MKILLLPSIYGGVSWWRFEVPAKALKEAGYDVTCLPFKDLEKAVEQSGGFYQWLLEEAPKYDILHCGYTGVMEAATAIYRVRDECNIPVVVDVDDNLDDVPTYNPGWKSFYPGSFGQRIAKTQIAHADGVSLSTKPLNTALSYLIGDKPSAVLENWVDVDSWDCPTPKERGEDQSIRVMITGGNGRFGDWAIIKEPLEAAMAKYDGLGGRPMLRAFFLGATPDWVLKWMSDKLNPLNNRCFYIHPTLEVPLFNQAVRYISPDIVLCPAQKNAFNACKSGLKFYEAALAKAAFLCTDFETYNNAPKGTCLKVDNVYAQWYESICALVEDASLRSQLVEKAHEYVLDSCISGAYIEQRISFYKEVIARRTLTCQISPPPLPGQEVSSQPNRSL